MHARENVEHVVIGSLNQLIILNYDSLCVWLCKVIVGELFIATKTICVPGDRPFCYTSMISE